MDLTPLIHANAQVIQRYDRHGFTIGKKQFEGPVMVFPGQCLPWDMAGESPAPEDFEQLLALCDRIDIVFFGGGRRAQLPPPPVRQRFKSGRVGLEPMDTGAACRSFNVLLAEGRRVAAALLPYA